VRAFLLLLISPLTVSALPLSGYCNGEFFANSLYACNTKEPVKVEVHIPPVEGKIRGVNCNREITQGGNPDDFHISEERKGFLFWKHTYIRVTENPFYTLAPTPTCPTILTTISKELGVDSGALFMYNLRDLPPDTEYSCAGETRVTKDGVGYCTLLRGAEFTIPAPRDDEMREFYAVSHSCGINKKDNSEELVLSLDHPGFCSLAVMYSSLEAMYEYRFAFRVLPRDSVGIDDTSVERKGGSFEVRAPLDSKVLQVEHWEGGKLIRRSPQIKDKKFSTPISEKTCFFAYGYNTSSHICYNKNGKL